MRNGHRFENWTLIWEFKKDLCCRNWTWIWGLDVDLSLTCIYILESINGDSMLPAVKNNLLLSNIYWSCDQVELDSCQSCDQVELGSCQLVSRQSLIVFISWGYVDNTFQQNIRPSFTCKTNINFWIINVWKQNLNVYGGLHDCDCMVVGFTRVCAISEYEPCSCRGVLDTAYFCDLQQYCGYLLHQQDLHWNIVESGVKYHKLKPINVYILLVKRTMLVQCFF